MSKVLFKLSGSIAAYKACSVISALVQSGHEVQTVVTPDALQFVGPSTLEGLTGRAVLSDIHQSGDMMEHIHLNTWADITILCPASANTLAKMAHGISDNLPTTLALARQSEKPYLVFPAMNTKMWQAEPTQKNIQILKSYGFQIYPGEAGSLACGEFGAGRLMEPEHILEKITDALRQNKAPTVVKTVLITAGGTSEKLDAVRVFSNTSTGRTGAIVAKHLSRHKHDVTFVGSPSAIQQLEKLNVTGVKVIPYESFVDLQKCLQQELQAQNYDVVVQAAAVSDFTPVALAQEGQTHSLPLKEKLNTSSQMNVIFEKNPKLIASLKLWSKNPSVKVIGFKLLQNKNPEYVRENLNKVLLNSDYTVLNFTDEVSTYKHKYSIYKTLKEIVFSGSTHWDLAEHVLEIVKDQKSTVKINQPDEILKQEL